MASVYRGPFQASWGLKDPRVASQEALIEDPENTGIFLGEWLVHTHDNEMLRFRTDSQMSVFTRNMAYTPLDGMSHIAGDVWFPVCNAFDVTVAREHPVYALRDNFPDSCKTAYIVLHRIKGFPEVFLCVPGAR